MINNIGYDKFETMLFTSPSGAVQILFIWIGILGCLVFPHRRVMVALILVIPPLIGNILLMKLPISAGWGLIVASWLASCISDIMVICLSLLASNVKGNTKRAVANTMFFIGYCAGCIGGPQLWTHKPKYTEGIITAIVTWVLMIFALCSYWYICAAENRRRDSDAATEQSFEFGADVTDKDDRAFRYSC